MIDVDFFNAARAEVEQVGPIVQSVLASDFARLVNVRTFADQADHAVRALIGQEEDRSSAGPKIDEPGITSRTFTGLFPFTAPVGQVGFLVTDAAARQLVPVAPPLNPFDLNFCWVVRLAPLAERTRVESLTFTIPGVGTVRDAKGNPVPAPGVPLTIPARLSATDDPRVRDMVGADSASAVLIGRWGTLSHPLLRPGGVRWGSTSPLMLDGQAGTLTVKLAYPDLDLAQEAQFGSRFIATWRAG